MRETTQASDNKVYGPYMGFIEKLKKPIELKGRVIRYKPVAKLLKNKKMSGGLKVYNIWYHPDIDVTKGRRFKNMLREKFSEIYTKDNNSRNSIVQTGIAPNTLSGKFLITDYGIQIAENFLNFKQIMSDIHKYCEASDIALDKESPVDIVKNGKVVESYIPDRQIPHFM